MMDQNLVDTYRGVPIYREGRNRVEGPGGKSFAGDNCNATINSELKKGSLQQLKQAIDQSIGRGGD